MASILLPPRINFLKEGWTRERSRTSRFFLASSGNLGGSKIWRKLLRWWKQTWVWSVVHDSPCSRRSVTSSYMLWRILIRQFNGCQHDCGHTTESTHVMNTLFYLQVWTTSIWSLDMLTEVKPRSWTSNRRQEKHWNDLCFDFPCVSAWKAISNTREDIWEHPGWIDLSHGDAESDLYILPSSQETLKQQSNFYILHSDKLHLINIKTPPALKFPVD